ncbi:MAG: DUF4397 domain-containing protein [Bacteroidota bacterium]
MKKVVCVLGVFAVVLGFAACKKKDGAPANAASVMFVNGAAGTSRIDVKHDNKNVDGAQGITFLKSSGYKYITAGSAVDLDMYLSDLGTPLVSQTPTLDAGKSYTVYAGGLITSPSFVLSLDDLAAPATSKAKVRLVNLSPDSMSVSVSAGTTTFASGVGRYSVSGFEQLAAGQYDIKSVDPANISTAVILSGQTLSAGKIYTLILTGTQAGTGQSSLKLSVINNN